jgi:hypothetical protein
MIDRPDGEILEEISEMIEEDKVLVDSKPTIFPFSEISAALEAYEKGDWNSKVVIQMD